MTAGGLATRRTGAQRLWGQAAGVQPWLGRHPNLGELFHFSGSGFLQLQKVADDAGDLKGGRGILASWRDHAWRIMGARCPV